jgi:DNA polymerase type B, organellar and viral
MDNAIRFGYTFSILKGYEFQEGLPFKSYMERMYNLRMQYTKGDPMNDIAKLLQNSLYGKFGMKSTGTVVNMFDITDSDQKEVLESMLDAYGLTVQDFIKIDNHVIVVRDDISRFQYSEEIDMYHGLDVNVSVASAVTASGRM